MKRMIVAVMLMLTVSCAGMNVMQTADSAAKVMLVAAEQYYAVNKAGFSEEDAALFEKFLAGFRLAIVTGEGIQESVERWQAFLSE